MKSIRWSLIVYFLILGGAALLAVSSFAYQAARQTVQDKDEATEQLLRAQFEQKSKEVRKGLDDELLAQASLLHAHARFQLNPAWLRSSVVLDTKRWLMTGASLSSATPTSSMLYLANLTTACEARQAESVAPFTFDEHEIFREGEVKEYFQIDSNWGDTPWTWRSRNLENEDKKFPVSAEVFRRVPSIEWSVEDRELEPGHKVRTAILRTPVSGTNFVRLFRGVRPAGGGPRADGGRQPNAGGPRGDPPRPPVFYIQCARETTQLDREIARLEAGLDNDLAELHDGSVAKLQSIRNRAVIIALATFVAMVLGGYWLIRLGLAPLRRLSDAVSLVSAKDFRLPFHEPRLPSELRPIVERLVQTLNALKRAFAREKQAAADISHELRTPLAALMTTTEVALRKPRSPEEYRELIEDCRATGQQMNKLVERLLALARLDAGVDTLRPQLVDVAELADQCASLVRPLAEAHELTLQVHRNGPAEISADPDKLREVVTNLLHNAIQYNKPHGKVELSVARHNGTLELEVRDTGIGIPAEAREHIFERFFRADPSRRSDNCNTGLGLAIVKGYVDLMGGNIEVETAEGQGSTFRVQLPARPAA